MHVVINSECSLIPEGVNASITEGTALLNLLFCLHFDPQNPPLADLLKKYHRLEGDWLILSPVHWQATHNDALVTAVGKELELDESESRFWFDVFAKYLAEDGAKLYYHDAETWLLNTVQQHPLAAKPPYQLLHQSLMPELSQLDSTLFWQKFITESQMLFSSQPRQSVINGLWPWGNAKLTEQSTVICADESFLPFAKMCSSRVTLYSPDVKLKEGHILLINNLSILSDEHREELTKKTTHWHWNNATYVTNPTNWFLRLWRKIIHAH